MSLDSGRAVDGSVEGGENGSAPAGVLGGRESRGISTISMGLVVGSGGTSRGSIGVRRSRGRGRKRALDVGIGFLASGLLSDIDGFAFFGERMGSVFTDLFPRTLLSVAFKIRGSLLASFAVSSEVEEVVLRLNLKSSPCGSTPVSCGSSSSLALSFRFAPVRTDALWSFDGVIPSSPPSGGDWKTDILLILILALLSLRFFRVSRLTDKAGFGPSWSCSTASSVWSGWD